jgi:nitrate reductase gamma subunit
MARRVKRGVEKKEALLEHYGEAWLGGEAHVGDADQTPAVANLLQNLRANRALLIGFGFASGILIGTGLAMLLSRRPRNRV